MIERAVGFRREVLAGAVTMVPPTQKCSAPDKQWAWFTTIAGNAAGARMW